MAKDLRTFLSVDSYPDSLIAAFTDPSTMNVRDLAQLYSHIYNRQEDDNVDIAFQFESYEVKKNGPLLPRHPRIELHKISADPTDGFEEWAYKPDAGMSKQGTNMGSQPGSQNKQNRKQKNAGPVAQESREWL